MCVSGRKEADAPVSVQYEKDGPNGPVLFHVDMKQRFLMPVTEPTAVESVMTETAMETPVTEAAVAETAVIFAAETAMTEVPEVAV